MFFFSENMEPKQQCYVCCKEFKQLTKHLAKNLDCMENYPILQLHRLRKRSAAIANLKRLKNSNLKRRLNYDPVAESIRNRRKYEKHQRIRYQQNKKNLKDAHTGWSVTFQSIGTLTIFYLVKVGNLLGGTFDLDCHRTGSLEGECLALRSTSVHQGSKWLKST